MTFSLGFIVILFLILFPGLIFRRLYFYGEFSKEFKSSYNLVTLLAISTVPGVINLILIFFFYDNFIAPVDLGEIIDKFKDLNNPLFKLTESDETPIKNLITSKVFPFISFLYVSSILFGLTSGRFIRFSNLDRKFKLLRFKNYWFYLFNDKQIKTSKFSFFKDSNKKHLFTKADILIESNNKNLLYSGMIVDYELYDDSCKRLSKIMLENAIRYSPKDGKRKPVAIPGNLLVVDCENLKNINLTYVNGKSKSILDSKIPGIVDKIFGFLVLLVIPSFIFKADFINFSIYNWYFELGFFKKFIIYIASIQFIMLFNPFVKKENTYRFLSFKTFLAKILLIGILAFIAYLI